MITLGKTYNLSASEQAMPVVLYRASEINNSKVNRFVASALLVVSVSVISLQTGFVLSANAQNNPISSPISGQETPTPTATPSTIQCPVGKVSKVVDSTIICVSQGQEQTQNNNQTQNNVITAPEVSPSPSTGGSSSSSSSTNPGAVINVTINPITAPEITPTPTPTPAPSSEPSNSQPSNPGPSNGGSSNNGGGSSAPSCNNEAPKAPYIVSAVTTGKNEITLNWTKPQGNVTHYSISYGVQKGKPLYGASNIGNVTSFKVKGLSGGVTYYFTVKAVNDCTPSVASNEVAMKVGGKFISTPAQGFKPGVLGKNNSLPQVVKNSGKPALAKPVVFNNEVKPVNAGLAGKVVNFFKGLF